MRRHLRLAMLAALALGLSVGAAWTQTTTGTITGTVTDSTEGVLPGVTLVLTNILTASVRSTVTNESGDYTFTTIPPGEYTVRADLAGFRSVAREGIRVEVNSSLRVSLRMDVETLEEAVLVVAGEVPLIQTVNAEIGGVTPTEVITTLPLNQRNFIELVGLEAGAHSITKVPGGGTHFIQDIGGGSYSVNGVSANATEFLFDGMNMRDIIANQVGINPTVDSIQEFKLQSSNYSAAFGGVAGGIVNVTSKAGSNQFHGSGWEFFRDDRLDARNFFDNESAPLRRNQFGGAVGGPILRNKVFFFGSYEGLRRTKGVSRAITVPTMLQRQGNFSETPNVVVRNPFTGVPFPGNVIPAENLDPVGHASLLALFPEPNLPGVRQNLQTTANGRNTSDKYSLRVDYNMSNSDMFFGRYSEQVADNIIPWGTFTAHPDKFLSWKNPARNAVASYTRILGDNVVNELRFGYNWFNNFIVDVNQGTDFAGQLGIGGLSRDPFLFSTPSITATGIDGSNTLSNIPNERNNNTFKLWDNVTMNRGDHSLGMGVSVTRYFQNGGAHSNAQGSFAFDGRFSGNSVADIVLGLPFRAQRCCVTGSAKRNFRKYDIGLYFQDDWRVSPNVTLNVGVRWDYYGAIFDQRNRFNTVDISQAPNLVIRTAGENGVPRGLRDPRTDNIAPRVGLVYRLPSGRTVVRGGVGLFYNSEQFYIWAMNTNPPFVDRLRVDISASTPGLITLANGFPEGVGQLSQEFSGVSPDYRDPRYTQWNLDLQHELPAGLTVEVTYVGNKGQFLNFVQPLNIPPNFQAGPIQPRRPIPSIGSASERQSVARSWYNGVTFKLLKRSRGGLYFNASYTRSKAEDEGGTLANGQGNSGSLKDPFTRDDDKGAAPYDQPHRFTASVVYPLPFGRERSGLLAGLARDWTVQAIIKLESGQPFTVNLPGDPANNGTSGLPDTVPGQDPNDGPKTAVQWFNLAAFQRPAPNTFGNSRRNSVRGPDFRTVDLAIQRNIPIEAAGARGHRVEFRLGIFNVFNRTNFLQPNANFGTSAAGTISGALDPRQVQLSVRYQF